MIDIKQLTKIVKISVPELSRRTGLSESLLRSKIQHKRELKINESQVIEKVLRDHYGLKPLMKIAGLEIPNQ